MEEPSEAELIAAMRGKLACVLADCGFAEAAGECQRALPAAPAAAHPAPPLDVDSLVRSVLQQLRK